MACRKFEDKFGVQNAKVTSLEERFVNQLRVTFTKENSQKFPQKKNSPWLSSTFFIETSGCSIPNSPSHSLETPSVKLTPSNPSFVSFNTGCGGACEGFFDTAHDLLSPVGEDQG